MDFNQLLEWCRGRENLKRDYTWYNDQHYKITFENGETYEWQRQNMEHWDYIVTVWLNGAMVSRDLVTDTWLENGSYGCKLVKHLPIEVAAA